jgi:hypothetical protein
MAESQTILGIPAENLDEVPTWQAVAQFFVLGVGAVVLPLAICRVGMMFAYHDDRWAVRLFPILVLTVYVGYRIVTQAQLGYLFVGQMVEHGRNLAMMVGFLVSNLTVTLLLAIELFAGWTAFWAELGLLDPAAKPGGLDALRAAEWTYIWHTIDAIPALDVAETLQWDRPSYYPDMPSAALFLAFKALVFVPVAVGFVRLLEGQLQRRWDSVVSSEEPST